MTYVVVFAPEAQDQLAGLYRHIAAAASPDIAARYTDAIVTYCEGFGTFPQRGSRRDDIRPGLRITSFRRRVVIAFTVDPQLVSIIGVFYGGQDYETALALEANDGELTR
jgi:plasmid stabilization system protein ParE